MPARVANAGTRSDSEGLRPYKHPGNFRGPGSSLLTSGGASTVSPTPESGC